MQLWYSIRLWSVVKNILLVYDLCGLIFAFVTSLVSVMYYVQ